MKYAVAFCLSAITVFAKAQSGKDSVIAEHYQTKDFDCAIFPKAYKLYGVPVDMAFTPTKEEVDQAEAALRNQLAALNKEKPNQGNGYYIDEHLTAYRRQYFGYTDKNGDRILYINCFYNGYTEDHFSHDWFTSGVAVNDGGSAFWQVKFDLKKKKLFGLEVNGEA